MSNSLVKQPIEWISTESALLAACQRWSAKKMVAVDTEFMRSQTYYPITGLIQLNDGERNYLIDPLAFKNFEPFADLLCNPNVVKILHSCSEDLEVFQRFLGVVPVNLLDTQIAAAFCGYGFSVGFGKLVAAVLGTELPKEETRSDWLQRPLSAAQVDYAAIDVEYLFQLATVLILKLKNSERLSWVTEDCDTVLQAFVDNQDIAKSYLRIKQAWRLSSRQLAILQNIATWREQMAQQRDVPRNRVLKEHSLMDIAQRRPQHIAKLRNLEGINERMIRTDGAAIIDCVSRAVAIDESELPATIVRPLSGAENRWAKKIRESVVDLAESLQLAPEMLLKKRDYETLTRVFAGAETRDEGQLLEALHSCIDGWRYALLGDLLAKTIAALNAARDESP